MMKPNQTKRLNLPRVSLVLTGGLLPFVSLHAQESTEEVFTLSPFEVNASEDTGYRASATMAGTRLRTELKDVGTAVQAVTEKFMDDINATDSTTLLQYTTNTEVAGTGGNFVGASGSGQRPNEDGRMRNPSESTRVRGLDSAENARDFYTSIIPWDAYNVERVDIQRGANSVLFGLGAPSGIVNADIIDANFAKDTKEVGVRFDQFGSVRFTLNLNQIVLPDELGVRVAAVHDNEKFQQNPAFEDDKRFFLAARYQPKFLQTERSSTQLKLKYEDGSIDRNAPRLLPPVDRITPFFTEEALSEGVYLRAARDLATKLPGHGISERQYDDGSPNPYYSPWVGDMTQVYGGVLYVFDQPNSGNIQTIFDSEAKGVGNIGGWGDRRVVGIRPYSEYASGAGLPFANKGVYKDTLITDPSIFDFYNNLIEGPNKGVEADFDALNLTFEQTFLDNKLGFELVHDKQNYKDQQLTHLNDWRNAISIDITRDLPTGQPNPNFGRPFVSDAAWLSGNAGDTSVETNRASMFYDLDLNDAIDNEFLGNLLGRHTFNIARNEFSRSRTNLAFQRYATDAAYGARIGVNDHQNNNRQAAWITYLGDSLVGRSLAGANISPITGVQELTSGQLLSFDTTWNAPGVDPAAAWTDPFDGVTRTQADNPANYVGYAPISLNLLDASNPEDRARLLRSFQFDEVDVKSNIALWQGRMWNDSILPMLAVREERVVTRTGNIPVGNGPDRTISDDDFSGIDIGTRFETENLVTKGLVVHVDRLLGSDKLPFNLTLFYNESSNFNPSEARRDWRGESIPSPSGTTQEHGFYISTKDSKYSARVNWYKTAILNATSTTLDPFLWQLGIVENWALNNAFQIRDQPAIGTQSWRYLSQGEGESDAAFIQRRKDYTQVVLDNPLPRVFHEQWGIDNIFKADGTVAQFDGDGGVDLKNFYRGRQTANQPGGLKATTDRLSEGMEFEFHAQPTDNWSITLNAAKTEAINTNVGGSLADFIEFRQETFQIRGADGTRLGEGNVWGNGTGGPNAFEARYAELFGVFELLKLEEGSPTSELRKWRANLVTTYSFKDGKLAGAYIGGGYRWQDRATLGFPLTSEGEFDLANPYKGPSEDNIDLWMGYTKKLSEKVDWQIQLNVANLFQGNNLIPVSVQPDGTPASMRIGPRQTWSLQNTFKF